MAKKVQQSAETDKPFSNVTPTVEAISQMNFQGTIIPHSWWQSKRLRNKSGRVNIVAALILSDICYWYRATEEKDEQGAITARRRKFSSDKLQKSYSDWADQFGITKRQAQGAAAFLIEKGLVRRELRTFDVRGMTLGNVMFFEPIVSVIKEMTFDTLSHLHAISLTPERDTSRVQTSEVSRKKVIPITSKRETNTENNPETHTKSKQRVHTDGETQGGQIR